MGLHSKYVGGASTATNGNVKDCFVKRYGRWVSESAKDGYVHGTVQPFFSFT